MSRLKLVSIKNPSDYSEEANHFLEKKKRSDDDWINTFLYFLTDSYHFLMENLNVNFKKNDERYFKDQIFSYYKSHLKYCSDFTLTLESKTDSTERLGFYDFKFQDTTWHSNQKHFAVEAKCLDGSNNSIQEYIHNKKMKKGTEITDGGVYRFLTLKYSEDMVWGGMLGFMQKGKVKDTITRIQSQLSDLEIEIEGCEKFGKNLSNGLFEEKISDFPDSFLSEHKRCFKGKRGSNIRLYHLFFDFT